MENQLELKCTLEEDDFMKFGAYQGRQFHKILLIVGAGLLITGIVSYVSGGYDFYNFNWWTIPIGLILLSQPFLIKKLTKQNFQKSSCKNFQTTFLITPDGIKTESKWESGSASNELSWDKIYEIVEYKGVFFIYLSKLQANIIPKRCFENEEQISLFRELYTKGMFENKPNQEKESSYISGFFSKIILIIVIISVLITFLFSYLNGKYPEAFKAKKIDQTQDKSNAAISEEISREESLSIKKYMTAFMDEIQKGSLDKALFLYRKIIKFSHDSDFFTGGDIENSTLTNKLVELDQKIDYKGDPSMTSDLLIQRGITEQAVGNYLYYTDAKKYQFAIIYYWLLACESFDQSNELYNNALAHRYKGTTMMDIGSPTQFAIEELQKALDLNDKDAITYYKLGNAYNFDKQYNEALKAYQKGIELNDKHELLYVNLGALYSNKSVKWPGDRENAYKAYFDLLKICTNYCHVANYNIGAHKYDEYKNDEALTYLDKAIEGAKSQSRVYRNAYFVKGKIVYLSGDFREAIKLLKIALNESGERPMEDNSFEQNGYERDTYSYLGTAYIKLQDYKNAERELGKAVKLFPGDQELMKLLNGVRSSEPK